MQAVFSSHNRPKHRKHEFAFSGLLTCAYDGCLVTAEIKRGKYTYYHCTGHRGKCALPYFREEELGERLGAVVKGIQIPDGVLKQLVQALQTDELSFQKTVQAERTAAQLRLATVRRRMEHAYADKLDGKIPEDFWQRKSSEWIGEESAALESLRRLETASHSQNVLNATRILELANKAHFLYVSQNVAEKARLLRMVLSNCTMDAVSPYPVYRKPFDLIAQRAKNEEWCARSDSNTRPSGS